MPTLSQNGAFIMLPAGSAEADTQGALVWKLYKNLTLDGSGNLTVTTDFSFIESAMAYVVGATAPTLAMTTVPTDVAGASTVACKGTASTTFEMWVAGYFGNQV